MTFLEQHDIFRDKNSGKAGLIKYRLFLFPGDLNEKPLKFVRR